MNPGNSKKIILSLGIFVLLMLGEILWLSRQSDPVYKGKRESEWFEMLCAGWVGLGSPDFDLRTAHEAFDQAGPKYVPYLTNQLRYDRPGFRQRAIFALQDFGPTSRFFTNSLLPIHRRMCAAILLKEMGPRAETAIPMLLDSWANDPPDTKFLTVWALAAIVKYPPLPDLGVSSVGEPQEYNPRAEVEIIRKALTYYPNVAVARKLSATNSN